MNTTNKKISLVLSGGAARGAFHLGALKALEELEFEIMAISASSIGAIVGAGYLSGKSPNELLEIFSSKEFRKAIQFNPLKGGIYHINKDAFIIDEIVNHKQRLEELKKPLHVSISDLGKGQVEYKNSGKLKELLLASSALIPIFPAVRIDGKYFADGAIIDNFPTAPIKNLPYPIVGINLHPNTPPKKHNFFTHLSQAMFLAWHSGVMKSITECDVYIAPHELSKYSIFRLKHLKELFDLGEKTTKEILANSF